MPLTGRRCVKLIVTDKAVFDVTPDSLLLRQAFPGSTPDDIRIFWVPHAHSYEPRD
jgi:acyl CoA:acetate/3-ketoacid CoA transferase beta subunit